MKRLKQFLAFAALLCLQLNLYAQTWGTHVQPVNPFPGTGGYIGNYNKMLVVNGNPTIVTNSNTNTSLIYVRATDASGTAWGTPVTVAYKGDVGTYCSFAIVSGNPAIAYYDGTNADLYYVRANDINGSSWGVPVAVATTGSVGQYASLCVVNGNPAIAYSNATSTDLYYVRANDANGSSWGSPIAAEVSTGSVGFYTSLCVVNGNPAIAYFDATNSDLRYIRANSIDGSSWGTSPVTVASAGTVGTYCSLAIVNGNPAISYYDGTNADLVYIRANSVDGSTWGTSPVTVSSTGNVGEYTSLYIVNGNPAISYFDNTNGDLKYIRANSINGSTWGTSPVSAASSGNIGMYTSLCVVNGNPAIACFDVTSLNLAYTRATDANGATWGSTVSFDISGTTAQNTDIIIVNSNPAIAYYDATSTDLYYVRATNAGGSTWGSAVTVASSAGSVGTYLSLCIISGNPAIAYYDQTNGDLKYVRATDISGSSWGSPVTVASTGDVGQYCKLLVVNGNPAIAYYDVTNGDLKYVRANSTDGSTWSTSPVTVASTGDVGTYLSLAIVSSNPAISYYDGTNNNLKYVRANSVDGSTWGTSPVTVVTGFAIYTSLCVMNGNPAIAYGSGAALRYIRANSVDGSTWGTSAVTVSSNSFSKYFITLTVVNGNPAIVYYDDFLFLQGLDVLYVRATDASGTAWGTPVTIFAETGFSGAQCPSMVANGTDVFIVYSEFSGPLGFVHGTSNSWTGTTNSTWGTGTNWSMGSVPASTDDVGFPSGCSNYPIITTTISCKSLIMSSGASVTVNTGGTLQLSGELSNDGTFTATDGTIVLNGTSPQTIPANTFANNTIKNLTLNNSSGATIAGTLYISDTYTPTSGTLTTGGFLTFKSTAGGTGRIAAGATGGGYISGNVTLERYVPGKRAFRFFAHPFASSIALSQLMDDIDITGSGGSANGFTTTTTNNPSAFYWDVSTADNSTSGSNPGWQPFTSANTNSWDQYELLRLLVRGGKGEGLTGGSYTPSAATFEAAGAVNQGTQVVTLTKGSGSTFVGCGNPFPSGVQMNAVARGSNVGANYYAWDATSGVAGAYVTNAWSLSYVLPAYGAFFTTVSANTNNTLTFEEADKAGGGAGLFKGTASAGWVELTIYDSSLKWDRLLINLDDNAMDVEDNLDGKKLYNPGLDFFTLSKDDVRLAVDVRPYNDGASIPLGLTAYNRYNRYVIRTGMFDIPAGTKLYLHDKWLNKKEELKAGFEYWFDVTTDTISQGNNRFEINMVGQPTNGIAFAEKQSAKMQLVPNPAREEVKISFDKLEGKAQLKLTGVTGQVIFSREINTAAGSITIPLYNVPAGIYIAELQSNNARFTKKLIVE